MRSLEHSLLLTGAALGSQVAIATPASYGPNSEIVAKACEFARQTGAEIQITSDLAQALEGANAVYTDVWASMGQEEEAAERKRIFSPFQVNSDLMKMAAPGALFR